MKEEHLHTRASATVFDVSHMGQVLIRGAKRVEFLERLVVADVQRLKQGESALTLFTNAKGGIIDDAIVTNAGTHLHVVVNGACKDKDLAHMREHAAAFGKDVSLEMLPSSETVLVALQGPKAASALRRLLPPSVDLDKMPFMTAIERVKLTSGQEVRLSRCGYTGEDGFEVSAFSASAGLAMFDALLGLPEVKPAGLGPRDSLRLEAGLCLYGNDIDDSTTPAEAGLAWVVAKRRREPGSDNFLGADAVLRQLSRGTGQKAISPPQRKRVGLMVQGKGAPAREHTPIFAPNGGAKVGEVTSGTFLSLIHI